MNHTENSDPLRSLRHAAEYLGVSPDSLRRYKQEGRIQFHQIGTRGHLKFRQSALEKFLSQTRKVAANG
jgi:excisionase family DNA binding protein